MVLAQLPCFVLDTNIVLYLLGNRLAEPLSPGQYWLSVITEMELLSYPSLSSEEEQRIQAFVDEVQVCGLSEAVKSRAIALRKAHGLKLPDAIIAATALTLSATLLTNDVRLLKLDGLQTCAATLRE